MRKTNHNEEYNKGKIGVLMRVVLGVLRKDPTLLDPSEFDRFRVTMYAQIPELEIKSKCPNCDALMIEYIFEFDVLDAVLLLAMADEVKKNLAEGLDFTAANKLRVHSLAVSYAIKSRTTQASKLGLIAKLTKANGKQFSGYWVITKRGFDALRGVPVPKRVKVWRGKIIERYPETVTISEALKSHSEKVIELARRGKSPKQDFTHLANSYVASDWVGMGWHEGSLL